MSIEIILLHFPTLVYLYLQSIFLLLPSISQSFGPLIPPAITQKRKKYLLLTNAPNLNLPFLCDGLLNNNVFFPIMPWNFEAHIINE